MLLPHAGRGRGSGEQHDFPPATRAHRRGSRCGRGTGAAVRLLERARTADRRAELLSQHGGVGCAGRRRDRGVDDLRLPDQQRADAGHRRSRVDEDGGGAGPGHGQPRQARPRRAAAPSATDSSRATGRAPRRRTSAPAITRWRKLSRAGANSPPHRANMLLSGATRMGIATAYSPKSKFKVFWALILAEPDEQRG